jgi:hypothetical protein
MLFDHKKLMSDADLARAVCVKLPCFLRTMRLAYAALAAPNEHKLLRAKKVLESSMAILENWKCDDESE